MATGTLVDVVMPQMGVSVSEGTITKWVKSEGDPVEADETLLEISTDKVDTEVPSPASGVLQQILVPEGETVAVGTKLAVIAPEGVEAAAPAEAPPQEAPPAEAVSEPATGEAAAEQAPAPTPAAAEAQAGPADGEAEGARFVSPVVARIAAEHGVDVSQVPGTGRAGRVTKKDILGFIESGALAPTPTIAPPPAAPAAVPARPERVSPAPEPPQAAQESSPDSRCLGRR